MFGGKAAGYKKKVFKAVPVDEGCDEYKPVLMDWEDYHGCQIKIYRSYHVRYIYATPFGRSTDMYVRPTDAIASARRKITSSLLKGEKPYIPPKKKKTQSYTDIYKPGYQTKKRYIEH